MAKRHADPISGDLATAAAGGNVATLPTRMQADRLARRLTWQDYARFLGLKLTTVYKIARGERKRPHALTVTQIEERMAQPVQKADTTVVDG